MILAYNSKGLLCLWMDDSKEPVFTWTYSVFEDFSGEGITPSMYKFMAEYVRKNFQPADYDGFNIPGNLEEDAFVRYYELSLNRRNQMHRKHMDYLFNLLHEEEQWTGGFEFGAENQTGGPTYDHADEV